MTPLMFIYPAILIAVGIACLLSKWGGLLLAVLLGILLVLIVMNWGVA